MTWFKVDDKLPDHRKVRKLGDDRLAGVGLWTMCGAWASDNLSDGFVPTEVVTRYDPLLRYAPRLVEVGLWRQETYDGEEGFRFHQWDERNPTREQVLQDRSNGAARQKTFRQRRAAEKAAAQASDAGSDDGSNGDRNALHLALVTPGVTPTPTRPDPTPSKNPSPPAADAAEEDSGQDAPGQREDVDALCARLVQRMAENGCKEPTVTKAWRTSARLLLDRDGRELDKALNLLDWCQADDFWAPNIHSLPTFRRQYDKLAMRARDEWRRSQDAAPVRAASGGYTAWQNPADQSAYHEEL